MDIFAEHILQAQQCFLDFIHVENKFPYLKIVFTVQLNCQFNLQLEVINLQCIDKLLGKFLENPEEGYKCFTNDEYTQFGNIYIKFIKSLYRSTLTDGHLQLILVTGTMNLKPQLRKMLSPSREFHSS